MNKIILNNNQEILIQNGITLIHKTKVNYQLSDNDNILDLGKFYIDNLEIYNDLFSDKSSFIKKKLINEIKTFIKTIGSNFIIIISNLDEFIDILNDNIFDSIIECFNNFSIIIETKNIYKIDPEFLKSVNHCVFGKLPINTSRYIITHIPSLNNIKKTELRLKNKIFNN